MTLDEALNYLKENNYQLINEFKIIDSNIKFCNGKSRKIKLVNITAQTSKNEIKYQLSTSYMPQEDDIDEDYIVYLIINSNLNDQEIKQLQTYANENLKLDLQILTNTDNEVSFEIYNTQFTDNNDFINYNYKDFEQLVKDFDTIIDTAIVK